MTIPLWADAAPEDYPTVTFEAGRSLFRIHRIVHEALHYSTSGTGRWDPPVLARAEYGTCYLAESHIGAYLEVFGRTSPIRESQVNERVVSEVQLNRQLTLADLTSPTLAGRVGPIPELSVGPSYAESQRLSARLYDAGLDGIRYIPRHDPSAQNRVVAVFSNATGALDVVKTMPIPNHVVDSAESNYELFVLPDSPLD